MLILLFIPHWSTTKKYCKKNTYQKQVKNIPISPEPQLEFLSRDLPASQAKSISPYQAKLFDFSDVQGLSCSQLQQHLKLYHGYVNKRNEIYQLLKTVDKTNAAGITYSPFRSLKTAETFALNGSILHELYFENLSSRKKMSPETEKLLIKNFGSITAFKSDVIDCASCSRGWVVTAYSINDSKLYNFVLDTHNETVPILALPILVIDIYEHAYMIDFGINRTQYLQRIWENINWDVVEQRIVKWVKKFEE